MRPAGSVELPAQAHFLTFGAGAVWAVGANGDIWRIDPSRGAITATVHVGASLGPAWPAFGHGSVWVVSLADGVLLRIHPRSVKVVARIPLEQPSDRPQTIAFSESAVWVATQTTNRLSRVDPSTDRLVEQFDVAAGDNRPADPAPSALAVLGNNLWFSEHHSDSIGRMPLRGKNIASTCHGSPGGGRLAASSDALWLADAGGVISRVDPGTGQVTDRLLVPGSTAGEIGAEGDQVWVAAGDAVVRIDAETSTVEAATQLPGSIDDADPERPPGGLALAIAPNTVWTTDSGRNRLLSFHR